VLLAVFIIVSILLTAHLLGPCNIFPLTSMNFYVKKEVDVEKVCSM
jgi:hypothetical protein